MMLRMLSRSLARTCSSVILKQNKSTSAILPVTALQSCHGWRRLPTTISNARSFLVSANAASSALADALQSELDYENDVNEPNTQIPAPPKGWKLEDEPGTSLVVLTKTFGAEEITLELSVSDQGDEIEEEAQVDQEPAADVDIAITFTVSIKKGDKEVSFDVQTDGTYIQILDVALLEDDDDDDAYEGPKYSELDDKLHSAFQEFLVERGINEELGDYLLQLADDKEQKEYVRWLNRMQKFAKIP